MKSSRLSQRLTVNRIQNQDPNESHNNEQIQKQEPIYGKTSNDNLNTIPKTPKSASDRRKKAGGRIQQGISGASNRREKVSFHNQGYQYFTDCWLRLYDLSDLWGVRYGISI